VDGRAFQRAFYGIFGHVSTSMILLQIDSEGVTIFPFEGNAPGAVHMKTVSFGGPVKTVKIETRELQVGQILGLV
jgi:hypothetical protein